MVDVFILYSVLILHTHYCTQHKLELELSAVMPSFGLSLNYIRLKETRTTNYCFLREKTM